MNKIVHAWADVLEFLFCLLCIRFISAGISSTYPAIAPTLSLVVGAIVLGWWRPASGLFAFTAAIPLFNGTQLFLTCPTPATLVFAGIFLGTTLRSFISPRDRGVPRTGLIYRFPWLRIAVLGLISASFLSLGAQLWRHHSSQSGRLFLQQADFGFGDSNYYLHSAFLWLQGLFYFQLLLSIRAEVTAWIRPVFVIYGFTLGSAFLFQVILGVPEPYNGYAYYFPSEDISAAGSIVVAVLIFFVAAESWRSCPRRILAALGLAALFGMLVASWSRAAWLAGGLSLLMIAWLRLPRRWVTAIGFLGIAALVMLNVNAERPTWQQQPYLWRLISLVRIENPTHKDPTRIDLFRKALDMSRERPLTGHGIGSFYRTSVSYARAGDPYGQKPDFAHNAFLEIAAELGIPVAVLFAGLTGWAIWRGFRIASNMIGLQDKVHKGFAAPDRVDCSTARPLEQRTIDGLVLLGATFALMAYMETQLTANSLNVYVSNQYFFWFSMAMLVTHPNSRPKEPAC